MITNFLILCVFNRSYAFEKTNTKESAITNSVSEKTKNDNESSDKPDKKSDIVVVKETKDTVYVLEKSIIEEKMDNVKKKIDIANKKGYGFSGGPLFGILAVNIKPIEKLCRVDPYLSSKSFSFSQYHYEPFVMSGGMGIAGIGNGVQLGGGGMHGNKKFNSRSYSSDSIISLDVEVTFGGVIIRKVYQKDKFNLKVSGLLGGGKIKVKVNSANSVFDDYSDEGKETKARFFCLYPSIGCSYSLFPIFHIGLDVLSPLFISIEGFSARTSDFYTINPGIVLKLIFGNLG